MKKKIGYLVPQAKRNEETKVSSSAIESEFYKAAVETKHWDDLSSGLETIENV
jgi:hypothetical protein